MILWFDGADGAAEFAPNSGLLPSFAGIEQAVQIGFCSAVSFSGGLAIHPNGPGPVSFDSESPLLQSAKPVETRPITLTAGGAVPFQRLRIVSFHTFAAMIEKAHGVLSTSITLIGSVLD